MTGGEILLADATGTAALGAALAERLRAGDVVALEGPLGAGKTTLARGLLAALGLEDEAPSPSFALVVDYRPPDVRLPVAHVDLYRVEDPDEVVELGLDDMLVDGALLIEWPERAGAGAWPDALRLRIEPLAEARRLTWAAPASWEARWPPARP